MRDVWHSVRAELDQWQRERRVAQFWWRDDDAADASDELKKMLALARRFDVTVGLSVIPAKLNPRLVPLLDPRQVLIHGFAHENHAREGQAKREFGGTRSFDEILGDLEGGIVLIRKILDPRVLPVLVPPWNRIVPSALAHLPRLGFRGLSTWKPRAVARPVRGLLQVNTHLDIIDWRHGRAIKDERLVAGLLLRKLRWRRALKQRASEPLGLLTHHAYWSPAKEQVVVRMLEATRNHPAAIWHTPASAFGL